MGFSFLLSNIPFSEQNSSDDIAKFSVFFIVKFNLYVGYVIIFEIFVAAAGCAFLLIESFQNRSFLAQFTAITIMEKVELFFLFVL